MVEVSKWWSHPAWSVMNPQEFILSQLLIMDTARLRTILFRMGLLVGRPQITERQWEETLTEMGITGETLRDVMWKGLNYPSWRWR